MHQSLVYLFSVSHMVHSCSMGPYQYVIAGVHAINFFAYINLHACVICLHKYYISIVCV